MSIPIVQIIVVLLVGGLVWYLIDAHLPIAQGIKTVIKIIMVVLLIIWLLSMVGMMNLNIG